jgi:2,3-bisphosphoglycerate-dependent phosphoglycerate mutase
MSLDGHDDDGRWHDTNRAMRTIYVVMHPEATHHVERVVGGWHESTLTPSGELTASSIGAELRARIPAGAGIDLFSSDLQRAEQTARIVAACLQAEPVLDQRLREKSYGEAEGKPQAWLDARFRPPPVTGDRMDHDEGLGGAETKKAFACRIYAVMDDILRSGCEHQVVITHGFAITFIVASWIKMPIASLGFVNFRAAAGSITVLREDDYFHNRQVASLSETHHLGSKQDAR